MADVTIEPWWWLSALTVALPVYLALRRRRNIWAIIAACLLGLAFGAILEGGFFAADKLTTGEAFIFEDAVAKAAGFPKNFFTGLLFIVAGALNPELLFLLPRVIEDILAGAASSNLGRVEVSLRAFGLIATIIVPL